MTTSSLRRSPRPYPAPATGRAVRRSIILSAILASALSLPACTIFSAKKQPAPTVPASSPTPSARTQTSATSAPPERTKQETIARPKRPPPDTVALLDPGNYVAGQDRLKDTLVKLAGNKALTLDNVGYYTEVQEAELRRRLTGGTSITVSKRGESIVIGPIADGFAKDSARLADAICTILDTVAPVFNEYVKTLITIHSYTDSSGNASYNQELSQRRALAVARYLIKLGVSSRRIAVVGHGDADPVAANATQKGRAQNRRIVIELQPLVRQGNSP